MWVEIMTTIVYRDGVLAADTSVWDNDCYVGQRIKVWQRDNGLMAGVAGGMDDAANFRDWFLGEMKEGHPEFKHDASEGLLIHPGGRVEWVGRKQRRMDIDGPFHAIGAGFKLAIGAMLQGATAEQALAIAASIDAYTRAPFTVLRLP